MNADWIAVRSGAQAPVKHHDGDAGWDLSTYGDWVVLPGTLMDVPTGIAVAPESGWWFKVEHRSSTPIRGLEVVYGIIDNGFRGELLARVRNLTDRAIEINHGDRLVQIVFYPLVPVTWRKVEVLPDSDRGARGFGSTGAGK